jgi:hypothetical protein
MTYSRLLVSILQLSRDAYFQDGTWVRKLLFFFYSSSFDVDHLHQVPASTAALKTMISRLHERTGWDIKELFTTMELADMIDAVVKEPPHMCVPMILSMP